MTNGTETFTEDLIEHFSDLRSQLAGRINALSEWGKFGKGSNATQQRAMRAVTDEPFDHDSATCAVCLGFEGNNRPPAPDDAENG